MRAKFCCNFVKDFGHFVEVELNAVCDDNTEENKKFNQYTPTGKLTMSIDRSGAFEFLKPGKDYYIDFMEVEENKVPVNPPPANDPPRKG